MRAERHPNVSVNVLAAVHRSMRATQMSESVMRPQGLTLSLIKSLGRYLMETEDDSSLLRIPISS